MRLLIVSPDYASHLEPMLQIASEWQRSTGDVVIASGPTVRASVEQRGLAWTPLRLGRGSNGGIIRADEQPTGEDDHLRAFFAATRVGAVATLRYQALARRQDLLFEPERVYTDLARIIADVRPDRVLVDHVAFGARLALHALGIDAASIVLGHPTALPAPGELYGLPPVWPAAIQPDAADLVDLAQICADSTAALTRDANTILATLAPNRPVFDDLTSLAGHPTIYMYPSGLHDRLRPLSAGAVSIGSLRHAAADAGPPVLPTGTGPVVLVAFGTFLSARDDLLRTATEAAHLGNWRLALAAGSTPIESLGPLPNGVVVSAHLPQIELLQHADVFITHGGNNSVTEACAAGVPMIVLPLSTDQFAAATAIERAGIGIVLDPNTVTAQALGDAVTRLLSDGAEERIKVIARSVAADGGAGAAVTAILDSHRDRGGSARRHDDDLGPSVT